MRKMRIPQIFTLIPGFYVDPKSQLTTRLPQKNKKHRQSSDYQCLQPVGVTGFEPATTRPPDAYSNRAELHPEATQGWATRTRTKKNRTRICCVTITP